jgi:hypothetical protein
MDLTHKNILSYWILFSTTFGSLYGSYLGVKDKRGHKSDEDQLSMTVMGGFLGGIFGFISSIFAPFTIPIFFGYKLINK